MSRPRDLSGMSLVCPRKTSRNTVMDHTGTVRRSRFVRI